MDNEKISQLCAEVKAELENNIPLIPQHYYKYNFLST